MEVDYQESSPKIILQHVGNTSKYLDLEKISKEYRFKNDSFDISDTNNNPLLVEPKVNVTDPVAISAALGVYKGFKLVLLGLNVPVPPPQIPEEVGPVTKPEREVVGIDSTDIIWGLGSFHCLSQQEPMI